MDNKQLGNVEMEICLCIYCKTRLSYPVNSTYIQCPKCTNTMNPRQPELSFINCVNCNVLLSHPPTSYTIQCPKCFSIMEIPDRGETNQNMGYSEMLQMPPMNQLSQIPPLQQMNQMSAMNQMSQMPQMSQMNSAPQMQQLGTQMTKNYRKPQTKHSTKEKSGHNSHSGVISGSEDRKTPKKRKDPSAPKRASNAYMIFCKQKRAELKSENPDLPFGKIGARLGEKWRTMNDEEKKPYEIQAQNDRDRYKKEMMGYNQRMQEKKQKASSKNFKRFQS